LKNPPKTRGNPENSAKSPTDPEKNPRNPGKILGKILDKSMVGHIYRGANDQPSCLLFNPLESRRNPGKILEKSQKS